MIKYIIDTYISGKPDCDYYEKGLFHQQSYAKFWGKWIIKKIGEDGLSKETIEELLDDLSSFMCRENGWKFSVGYDVASDVLDFLYILEENGAII